MGYAFDEDITIELLPDPAEGRCFGAAISHRWDTVGPPNGGFLLALAARGLMAAAPFPDPVTLTGHFLRPSRHTPVEALRLRVWDDLPGRLPDRPRAGPARAGLDRRQLPHQVPA